MHYITNCMLVFSGCAGLWVALACAVGGKREKSERARQDVNEEEWRELVRLAKLASDR